MIKTIIFDIGNVLLDFQWNPFFRKFCEDEKTFLAFQNATIHSKEWHEFDRGVLSTQEVLQSFIKKAPSLETIIQKAFENIDGILVPFSYTIPWIQSLKEQGYQVLVLSNFSEKFFQDCHSVMGFLKYTDGGILSYRDQLIKPDPAIYQLLLDRYHLIPDECVFIDDLEKNVIAARNLGIHGIQFTQKENVEIELKKLGVTILS